MKQAALLLILVLGGCSGTGLWQRPEGQPPFAPVVEPWENWRLSGRVSVRTEEDGWIASIDWLQTGEQYQLDLRGPFGQGAVQLAGGSGFASLSTADGQVLSDRDPELLLQQVIGMRMPVKGLRYWVHGLANPGGKASSRWSADGVRTELHQAGWVIRYRDYREVSGRRLPTRIRLENDRYQVLLRVDEWQRNGPEGSPGRVISPALPAAS